MFKGFQMLKNTFINLATATFELQVAKVIKSNFFDNCSLIDQ